MPASTPQPQTRAREEAQRAPAPRVTAIVLNWCAVEDTSACVRSLLASDYPALEVLIVDNASPDGSGEVLHRRFPDLPYLPLPENSGYTGGNNAGLAWALENGCDYALVVNDDTVVDAAAVSRLVAAAQAHPRAGAVAPKILYADDPRRIWFGGGRLERTRAVGYHRLEGALDANPAGGEVEEVTFLSGCCLLIPSPVLREVGTFEEDFFAYCEDVDLSLRLLDRGYALLYQPQARILHRVQLDAEPTAAQLRLAVRNRRRLARRRLTPVERVRFALFFYPTRLLKIVGNLARGEGRRAMAVWQGMREP